MSADETKLPLTAEQVAQRFNDSYQRGWRKFLATRLAEHAAGVIPDGYEFGMPFSATINTGFAEKDSTRYAEGERYVILHTVETLSELSEQEARHLISELELALEFQP